MWVWGGGEGQGLKAELSRGRAREENALERRALPPCQAPGKPLPWQRGAEPGIRAGPRAQPQRAEPAGMMSQAGR